MKNVQLLLLIFSGAVVYSSSVCLYETNFYHKGGLSIAHSIFKTSVQRREDHFSLFLITNACSGKCKNAHQIDCS